MTVKDAVLEKMDRLPVMRQREVLDFAEFLEQKDAGREVLPEISPKSKQRKPQKARIVTSPVTGLPVIEVDKDAPILTSEMVREMLADFP